MNILLLTSVYPSPSDKNGTVTKVVQYFANEWVKMGHKVIVVHNTARYPAVVHMLPEPVRQKLTAKLNFLIPPLKDVKEVFREENGVRIYKFPILKLQPHGGHPKSIIHKQAQKIQETLLKESFIPDIIMGHWMSPQIQLIDILKDVYHCRTSLVLHGRGYINDRRFDCKKYLKNLDALGCRSKAEAEFIKKGLGISSTPYICYSGVPDSYLENCEYIDKFDKKPEVWRFIYVGRLVAYKHLENVLAALPHLENQNNKFEIIGSGNEESNLRKLTIELDIDSKVSFRGQLPREEVLERMKQSNCFVMISKGEVFGLVYLEAMANSCISIGSIGEGIDGVIVDGKNGILSKPADTDDLVQTLNRVMRMGSKELKAISYAGYQTAQEFSDSNVAKKYLQDAMEHDLVI